MTPYFTDANGKAVETPFGDTTLDKAPAGVGVSGVAGVVSLQLSRPGWTSPVVKLGKSPYFIANNFKANTYTLAVTVGGKTTKYMFNVTAPTQPNTPPVQNPPVEQPPAPQTGADPRTAYPVSLPYSPLPQDAQGWTILNASVDSRIIYVAPSGSDANAGTLSKPVKTLAKAMSQLRSGYPDQILLQRGGDYSTGNPIQWKASGRSPSEPCVLGSYGTGARPILDRMYTVATQNVSNVAIVGLHLYAKQRDWTASGFDLAKVQDNQYGLEWAAAGSGNLLEDCRVSYWWYNIYLHGGQFVLRRNVIDHAWTKSGEKAQGIYISGGGARSNGPAHTIEENIIYHNGWADFKDGKPPKGNATGVWMFSHGIYCSQETGPILYRSNIVAMNANNGINGRSGGVLEDNLFIDNSTAGYVGRIQRTADKDKECWMRRNVAVNCEHGNGFGLETPFWSAGRVEDNLIAHHGTNCANGWGLFIDPSRDPINDPYIKGDAVEGPKSSLISVVGNILSGAGYIRVWAGSAMTIHAANNFCDDPSGVVYQGSTPKPDLLKGVGWNNTAKFPDPSRDVSQYNAKVLFRATDFRDFCAEAAKQEKANWNPQYGAASVNEWVRAGFGK